MCSEKTNQLSSLAISKIETPLSKVIDAEAKRVECPVNSWATPTFLRMSFSQRPIVAAVTGKSGLTPRGTTCDLEVPF